MKEMINKNKKVIIVLTVFLLLSVSGLTLAYFVGQIGPAATANINLTTKTVDNLTFTTGNDITIGPVNQANFAQGSGNKSGSTTATATLKANTGNNSATETYNVYLKIDNNTFEYTTSNNTAELILKVTNPSGNIQTISGLTQVTSEGITGYDITNKVSIIPIATNYTITTTSSKTDTWTAQVYFINLNSDQQVNSSKTFNAELVIEKRDPITVTFDANGGSVSQTSKEVTYGTNYGTLPTPTKSGATFLGWNGKNKFNEEEIFMSIDDAEYENGHYVFFESKAYDLYGRNGGKLPIDNIKSNTRYTTTITGFAEKYIFIMVAYFTDGSYQYINFDPTTESTLSFTTPSGKTIDKYTITYYSLGVAHITRLQLEEGSTATLYEPYYVTSDVAVTQESNHTLTAVWG